MQDKPFEEVLEQRLSKLIDKKLRPIKKSLQQQEDASLRTRRVLASFMVKSTVNICSCLQLSSHLRNQVTLDSGEASADIKLSDEPLDIAIKFYNQCFDSLKKAGIKTLKTS